MGVSIQSFYSYDGHIAYVPSRYEQMNGMNRADCTVPPLLPCTAQEGWPSRDVYVQACSGRIPEECGGQGSRYSDQIGSALLVNQNELW